MGGWVSRLIFFEGIGGRFLGPGGGGGGTMGKGGGMEEEEEGRG